MRFNALKKINFSKLTKISDTPHSISLGFAIGVFMAFNPFIGFHIILALFFSWLLGANYFSSVLGTFIGTPITYPLMWIFSILVGGIFFNIGIVNFSDFEKVSFYSWEFFDLIKPFFWAFIAGSTILGFISGFLSYFLTKKIIIFYRKRKSKRKQKLNNE